MCYALADLVAVGLLNPLTVEGAPEALAGRSRVARELETARIELAVAQARIAEMSVRIDHLDSENGFLRSLVERMAVA